MSAAANKPSVLVTGGAGYVGSHVCKALANAGYMPVVYDNLATGHRWAVKWGPLEEGDVRDSNRIETVLRRHRAVAVLHFAALSLVGASAKQRSWTIARQCWQSGHQYVMRCPITSARIGVPHTLHGSPARPYTKSSCSK